MSNLIHRVFSNYSFDGQFLDKEGCKLLFIELYGRKPNKEEMQLLTSSFDVNSKGEHVGVTFNGILSSIQLFQRNFAKNALHNEEQKRLSFDCLDLNSKDFVMMDDLYQLSNRHIPALPTALFRVVFREFDEDCDKRVSYEDYRVAAGLGSG
ncbi:unnamed protein product [Trichobilharzia szidati]|nr:unnamed protein product [Trichobilharzia szidati]